MDTCGCSPYVLPTMCFVGGETQEFAFYPYSCSGDKPFSLADCEARFSVVNFLNRGGAPLIIKEMTIRGNDGGEYGGSLYVKLDPTDTVNLNGKYIYQISIKDVNGDMEIPKQGIMYITENIDKGFIP